jgi:hypothetical protein
MKVVTLTDAVLLNLAKNPNARSRVPALNPIHKALNHKPGRRGCSSCGKRARLSSSVVSVRTAISKQPAVLQVVKQVLKADRLIMYVRGPKGKTQRKEV